MKPIEFHLDRDNQKIDFKTRYLKFRLARIKHQLWLNNRKRDEKILYEEDKKILDQCQDGCTGFFDSAGYYIKDLFPTLDVDVLESNPIVKQFYPACITLARTDLPQLGKKYDNFIITNSRSDHWVTLEGLADYFQIYTQVMKKDCKFFYSFRDTQMLGFNRLKVDMEKFFYDWAISLQDSHGLQLVGHDINFKKKIRSDIGQFDLNENPDTTNGNIKFVFKMLW